MLLVKQLDSLVELKRTFVKYAAQPPLGKIEIYQPSSDSKPLVSIIIPTVGAARQSYLPGLIEQIERQSWRDYEVILIIGDNRQGRAINCGAALASGKYLLICDDDTRLGSEDLIEKMVEMVSAHPEIGMAGVANLIPPDASWFVRRVMYELPRRTSPLVTTITDSDLAEHPCCLIPKAVFYQIGGENELIPRGLDPYLRQAIREAGYRVVVLPGLYMHHLPPQTLRQFVRQFYRNGKMAAYVNKFYPQFVVELAYEHGIEVEVRRSIFKRVISYLYRLLKTFVTLKIFYLLSLLLYLIGYSIGYLTLNENDV